MSSESPHPWKELESHIERIVSQLDENPDYSISVTDKEAINAVIEHLDSGDIRVAERVVQKKPTSDHKPSDQGQELADGGAEIRLEDDRSWQVNTWVKKAISLYFKISPMESYGVGPYCYSDKIPLKTNFEELTVRVVPPATARYGSFMEPGVILMPSYVNIGAYIGKNSMVDTWATVGSCAQIGAGVHLSGGVGIGGVLEPPGASPVIIEDGAFIGSRAIVVEGVRVKKQAVVAANVTLTASSYIYDLSSPTTKVYRGVVPERAVVVPGVRKKSAPGGEMMLSCAYIIGERKASTDDKTSLNQVLREFSLSV